jgi:hypothetical protein
MSFVMFEKLGSIGYIGDIECETKPLDICFSSHGQSVKKTESKEPNSIEIDDVKLEKRMEMSFTDTFSPFDTIVSSSFKHKNTCKFDALSFILAMVSLRF